MHAAKQINKLIIPGVVVCDLDVHNFSMDK